MKLTVCPDILLLLSSVDLCSVANEIHGGHRANASSPAACPVLTIETKIRTRTFQFTRTWMCNMDGNQEHEL